MSKPQPISPELLEQTAALLHLNYQPEVGEIGGSLVYGDVHERALVALFVYGGAFTLEARCPDLPHLPHRDIEGFLDPRLNGALEALGGKPSPGEVCSLSDWRLYLRCDSDRIGRSLQPQCLANLIQVASEIVNEWGVPLVPVCQSCRLRPGSLIVRPDPLYYLERLCSRCLPQPALPGREAESAGTLNSGQEAEFVQLVLAESHPLYGVTPSGVRLWKQCPQPYATVVCGGGEWQATLDLPLARLQEMPLPDLAVLAALDLHERVLVAQRQKARIKRWWHGESSVKVWEVSDSPQEQALSQAISRHGKDCIARIVFTRQVLERLDLLARDRQAKLELPDSRWELACQQAQDRVQTPGLQAATLPAYVQIRQAVQDCPTYPVELSSGETPFAEADSEEEHQILWKPYRAQLESRVIDQPDQADSHFSLALFDLQLERWDQAYQGCKNVLSLQPDHPGARSLESWLQVRLEKPIEETYLPQLEEPAWLLGGPLPEDLDCLDLANQAYESFYAARFPGNAAVHPPQRESLPGWAELAELRIVFHPTGLPVDQLLTLDGTVGAWPQVWGLAQTLRELAYPCAAAPAHWLTEMIERARQHCDGPDLSHEQQARIYLLVIAGVHGCLQDLYASLSRGPLPAKLAALETWLKRLEMVASNSPVLGTALCVGRSLERPTHQKKDALLRLRTWVLKLAQMVGPPPDWQAAQE